MEPILLGVTFSSWEATGKKGHQLPLNSWAMDRGGQTWALVVPPPEIAGRVCSLAVGPHLLQIGNRDVAVRGG